MSGNAFGILDNVKKEELPVICKALEDKLGLPVFNNLLGSTGKKPISGDIDVAVDQSSINLDEFVTRLESSFDEVKRHGGQNSWSVIFEHGANRYQVDFMYGDLDWLKFYFYSPSEGESKFKGAHRNLAIVGLIQSKLLESSSECDDYGTPVDITRYILSPSRGLCRVNRKRLKVVKGSKTVWKEIETEISKTKSPTEIAHALGVSTPNELCTLEQVCNLINLYGDTDKVYQNVARNFLNARLVTGYDIPDCIKRFL